MITVMTTASRNIIKDLGPRRYRISPTLEKILNANGMQAQIGINDKGQYVLMALAHDSREPHYYTISEEQFSSLSRDGGRYSTLNKSSYNTFTDIVKDDFHLPRSYYEARAAMSPVNMGQWGKQLAPGETGYGYIGMSPMGPFRGQRFGLFDRLLFGMNCYGRYSRYGRHGSMQSPFMVYERKDGYLRPGEYRTGGGGFYDKGRRADMESGNRNTALQHVRIGKIEVRHLERPKGKSIPLSSLNGVKWNDGVPVFMSILASHGISIQTDGSGKHELYVKSDGVDKNFALELSEEDYRKLTAPFPSPGDANARKDSKKDKNKNLNVAERLALMNQYITKVFDNSVTKEMLESKDYVKLRINPEVAKQEKLDIDGRVAAEEYGKNLDVIDMKSRRQNYTEGFVDKWNSIGTVMGGTLDKDYGFYVPVAHGRRLSVGEVQAYKYNSEDKQGYRMTAVIGGKVVSNEISEKEYIEFLNKDDQHRLEQFAETFKKDVSIKSSSHGGLEDADKQLDIATAEGTARLSGSYSLIGDDYQAYLTDAVVWNDEKTGDYSLNVRTSKDAGVWSYKITKEQYDAFRQGNDTEKIKVISRVVPFYATHKDALGNEVRQDLKIIDNSKLDVRFAAFALTNNENITPKEAARHEEAIAVAHRQYVIKALPSQLRKDGDKDMVKLAEYVEKYGKLPATLTESEVTKLNKVLEEVRSHGLYNQDVADKLNKSLGLTPQIVFAGLTDNDLQRLGLSKDTSGKILELQGKKLVVPNLQQAASDAIKRESRNSVEGWKPLKGDMLKESKEWRRSGNGGRSVSVGDITIEKARDPKTEQEIKGKYKITAVIDGNPITHEINQKTFNKLGIVNNDERLKLFDKIFPEIEMHRKPGDGIHIGSAILAAFDAVRIAVGMGMMMGRHGPAPDIYTDHQIYYTNANPNLNFDAQMARMHDAERQLDHDMGIGI